MDGLGDRKAPRREMGVLISCLSVPHYTLSKLGPVTSSPWTQFAPLLREVPIPLSLSLSPKDKNRAQPTGHLLLCQWRPGRARATSSSRTLLSEARALGVSGGLEIKTSLNQRHMGHLTDLKRPAVPSEHVTSHAKPSPQTVLCTRFQGRMKISVWNSPLPWPLFSSP